MGHDHDKPQDREKAWAMFIAKTLAQEKSQAMIMSNACSRESMLDHDSVNTLAPEVPSTGMISETNKLINVAGPVDRHGTITRRSGQGRGDKAITSTGMITETNKLINVAGPVDQHGTVTRRSGQGWGDKAVTENKGTKRSVAKPREKSVFYAKNGASDDACFQYEAMRLQSVLESRWPLPNRD